MVVLLFAAGCGRTGTICETATDCGGIGGGGGSSCPGGQTLCPGGCKNLSFDLAGDFGLARVGRRASAFLAGGAGAERLRFQVKLFETSGVIELHYCALELNGGSMEQLTGSTSTIGLENLAGTEGVQHSFDQANSISSGAALRFVPQ